MDIVRRALFFIALTVAMKAMFGEVNALVLMWVPAIAEMAAPVREAVLHLPYALIAALVLTRAEVWARLPAMITLYVPLVVVVAAMVMADAIARTNPELAVLAARLVTLVLAANVVMILTRLTPKPGFIYEGSSVPSVKTFLAMTIALALSIPLAAPLLGVARAGAYAEKVPAAYLDLAVAAIVVAAYIMASGIRFRSLQPNSAATWMVLGIVLWVIAQLLEPAIGQIRAFGYHKERFVAEFIERAAPIKAGLEIAAHILLFAGSFSLVSHLLPARDRIARQ